MQGIWGQFVDEHGEEPATTAECFAWATRKGLWQPRPVDVAKIFNREMASALRDEKRTDASGRTYRARQCVRENAGGIQMTLWGDTDKIPRRFMEKAVRYRRKGLVDDAFLLKQDVDHFNEYRYSDNPIQLPLDLTDDVAEREILEQSDDADTGTG